jgi:hypothetical protein
MTAFLADTSTLYSCTVTKKPLVFQRSIFKTYFHLTFQAQVRIRTKPNCILAPVEGLSNLFKNIPTIIYKIRYIFHLQLFRHIPIHIYV